MFFEEHLRKIYRPPGADEGTGFDPLNLKHVLFVVSDGNLYRWLEDRNAPAADARTDSPDGLYAGDVSADARQKKAVAAARAEIELARVSKRAFGLDPNSMDADALEWLYDFMEWLEKKGSRGGSGSGSDGTSPPSSSPPTTPTT